MTELIKIKESINHKYDIRTVYGYGQYRFFSKENALNFIKRIKGVD